MFKVIIAGGREFNDYKLLKTKCDKILINKLPNVEIVSGTAVGADKLGELYALENRILLKFFPAPWEETEGKPSNELGYTKGNRLYWKRAGMVRNKQMAEYADAAIIFWDGESRGTKNMIEEMEKLNKDVRIIKY